MLLQAGCFNCFCIFSNNRGDFVWGDFVQGGFCPGFAPSVGPSVRRKYRMSEDQCDAATPPPPPSNILVTTTTPDTAKSPVQSNPIHPLDRARRRHGITSAVLRTFQQRGPRATTAEQIRLAWQTPFFLLIIFFPSVRIFSHFQAQGTPKYVRDP